VCMCMSVLLLVCVVIHTVSVSEVASLVCSWKVKLDL